MVLSAKVKIYKKDVTSWTFQAWRWAHYIASKHQEPITYWHSVTSQWNRQVRSGTLETGVSATTPSHTVLCLYRNLRPISHDCCPTPSTLPRSSTLWHFCFYKTQAAVMKFRCENQILNLWVKRCTYSDGHSFKSQHSPDELRSTVYKNRLQKAPKLTYYRQQPLSINM